MTSFDFQRLRLREILIDSWTNYLGMPILFTWIELLKEEAMQMVLSQKNIDLNKIFLDENEADEVSFWFAIMHILYHHYVL